MDEERLGPQPFIPQLVGIPGARAVFIDRPENLVPCINALGLRLDRPVLVLVGGADGLDPVVGKRVFMLFRNHLIPLLERLEAVVVDGGTDAGVMACAGRANGARSLPLVGAAAVGTVAVPDLKGAATGNTALEPNHSHFLLVPGDRWGDESPWLSLVATTIAGPYPSVTLVIGGGRITRLDISHSLSARRPTILLTGSGGVADELAVQPATSTPSGAMTVATEPSADILAVSLDDTEHLSQLLLKMLSCAT